MKTYLFESKRLLYSKWKKTDLELAKSLWGDKDVDKYITQKETFSNKDIQSRLNTEIENDKKYNVQYWKVFTKDNCQFIGAAGFRPVPEEDSKNTFELGIHLKKDFWGKGYAYEASKRVIDYAENVIHADKLFAGHHPDNKASAAVLKKLGFQFTGDTFYEPTGLCHPSYEYIIKRA